MPLQSLNAIASRLPTLEILREAPLRSLRAAATPLDSIEPLRGKPLTVLDVRGTRVSSLEPLHGITTLTECYFADTKVSDVSFLRDCPALAVVHAYNSPVTDFSWLAGKPITELRLTKTSFRDLTLLRGAPLQKLHLQDTAVDDAAPLANCVTLTELVIPRSAKNIGQLRQLTGLRRISFTEDRLQAAALEAAEFWKVFDAENPR
jgi:Leucine-rich repeat (LRR) protein